MLVPCDREQAGKGPCTVLQPPGMADKCSEGLLVSAGVWGVGWSAPLPQGPGEPGAGSKTLGLLQCALPGPPVGIVAPKCSPSMMIFGLILSLNEPLGLFGCGVSLCLEMLSPVFRRSAQPYHPSQLCRQVTTACCWRRVQVFLQASCPQRVGVSPCLHLVGSLRLGW